ncbi:mitochondrial 54S ribosomal protein YmL47 [Flammula alnicola]|nr:mitochondrial 54S ribosomal protein YmL47 [Flammula alnicola]
MFSLSSITRRTLGGGGLARAQQPSTQHHVNTVLSPLSLFTRGRAQLAPKQVKNIKRHKGRIPIPTGGSTKGTTLAYGEWGIRIKGNGARLTAKQLSTAQEVILKKLKILKGSQVYLRVFPDIPVCIKGNETRMGKGKGTFEFWATRVPIGRVIFEIGGVPIREELARDILRQAAAKLPTKMEFINKSTPPRLGYLVLTPPKPVTIDPSTIPEGAVTAVTQPTLS